MLYCIAFYCAVLCFVVLCCALLFSVLLYCAALCCIVFSIVHHVLLIVYAPGKYGRFNDLVLCSVILC